MRSPEQWDCIRSQTRLAAKASARTTMIARVCIARTSTRSPAARATTSSSQRTISSRDAMARRAHAGFTVVESGIVAVVVVLAFVIAIALSAVASLIPSIQAGRVSVTDALRRVG